MYTKPTLQQYGSFRDLTLIGLVHDGDGGIVIGPVTVGDGCTWDCNSNNRS